MPAILSLIVAKNIDDLGSEPFKRKFGVIYDGISLTYIKVIAGTGTRIRRRDTWVHTLIWTSRRTVFVAISVLLKDKREI